MRSLIVAGIMTDQCVESAVRDACDLGYLVTLVTDACTTDSAERHEQSLIGIRGYCRQRTTDTASGRDRAGSPNRIEPVLRSFRIPTADRMPLPAAMGRRSARFRSR